MDKTVKDHLYSALRVFASAFLGYLGLNLSMAGNIDMKALVFGALTAAISATIKLAILWVNPD